MRWFLRPAAWTRWALDHATAAMLVLIAVTIGLGAGAFRLRTEVGYRAFLGPHHPLIGELDDFLDRFGGGLAILAVWSCADSPACASALDAPSLAMADDVARRVRDVDGVVGVDSPATSPLIVSPPIGLPEARRLAVDGVAARDIDLLREQALADPLWVGQLVSANGAAGAVIVHLRDSSGATAERAFAALREATAAHQAAGFRFAYVGGPVEFVVAGGELQRNTQRVMPVMVGLIAVALVLLFGSLGAAAAALVSVGVAVLWTLGLMGWVGWAQNSMTQILPPLILVIGICDGIHVLGHYAGHSPDVDDRAAMLTVCEELGPPCLMTTLTTVAAFGSLAVSRLESIARFGTMAATGVLFSLVLTFALLPLLAQRLPRHWFSTAAARQRWHRWLEAVVRVATGPRRWRFVALSALAAVAALVGVARLRIDASFEDLYGADSDVVRWARQTERALRPPDTLEVVLEPRRVAETLPADAFAVAAAVEDRLVDLPGLAKPLSVVDPMRRLNRMLHRDELPLAAAGDDKDRPASVWRLLRSRDPAVTDFLVDLQRPALRVTVGAAKLPQEVMRSLLAEVDRRLAAVLPPQWQATVTGPLPVVAGMIDEIRMTQLESFALAALIVFVLLLVFYRSLRLATLAMVPTLLPIVVTLGTMGAAGIALDVGSAMVATVVLGLAVDNAIHLLSAAERARSAGADPVAASAAAIRDSGRGVATSSLALAAGFVSITFSAWKSIASFGLVSAMAIGSGLFAALFVLPALMTGRARSRP